MYSPSPPSPASAPPHILISTPYLLLLICTHPAPISGHPHLYHTLPAHPHMNPPLPPTSALPHPNPTCSPSPPSHPHTHLHPHYPPPQNLTLNPLHNLTLNPPL
ncbi:hypothetical protein CVT24_010203, partial [Panaeolus cyanescens]